MKFQDYIHYYIGCEVFHLNNERKFRLITYEQEGGDLVGEWPSRRRTRFTPWELIKPILRKLEDMTEQEMIGLLQSMVPSDMEDKPKDDDYDIEMFYNDDGLMVDGDIAVGANFTCICFDGQIGIKKCGSIILFEEDKDVTRDQLVNTPMAFNYLLKQSFDLFNLIENGLAIDSKTLNQNH
jgi:hypothetical protein